MELAFSDRNFRDLCLNESLARQALGPKVAERLKNRLADLTAAPVASDLFGMPGKLRELPGDHRGCLIMDLIDGHKLVIQCGHVKERASQSGEINWSRVRRIKILGLENAHE